MTKWSFSGRIAEWDLFYRCLGTFVTSTAFVRAFLSVNNRKAANGIQNPKDVIKLSFNPIKEFLSSISVENLLFFKAALIKGA